VTVALELVGGPLCGETRVVSAERDAYPSLVGGCVSFVVDGRQVFYRVDPEFYRGHYVDAIRTETGQ